jgi:hypothetical protein
MGYLYGIGSGVLAIVTVAAFVIRHYRKSISKDTLGIRSYVWGNIRLRVGAVFSRVLAGQLGARRYAELALRSSPSTVSIPSVQHFQLDINQIYVKLSMTSGNQATVSDRNLLARDNKNSVLIFGEPGSGKSTLTKKLFRDACRSLFAYPAGCLLPVRVELKDFNWPDVITDGQAGDWLLGEVKVEIESIKGMHSDGFVTDAYAKGQGLLIFLDGLDEVTSDQLGLCCGEIRGAIRQLMRLGGRSQVIVTGRSQLRTVLPRDFIESFDDSCTIRPFSAADVFSFLQGWPFAASGRGEQVSRIFRSIQSNPSLQEMCTNPLVLSMYVARDQLYVQRTGGRSVRLPDNRSEFYQEIVNELLLYRRGEQLESAPIGSQLKQKRENLLGQIALRHLEDRDQPVNSISWAMCIDLVKRVFNHSEDIDAEQEMRRLALETGIYSEERKSETVRFLHLTLCEFLAAKDVRESTAEKLEEIVQTVIEDERATRSHRLLEVAIFALSLVGRTQRTDTIYRILEAPSAPNALLLRTIRDSYESSEQILFSALEKVHATLRKEGKIERYLPDVHLLLQCFLNAQTHAPEQSKVGQLGTRNVIYTLVDDGPAKYSQLFSTYLSVDPKSAIREAKNRGLSAKLITVDSLVEVLQDPEVVAYALERRKREPELWAVALAEAALRYSLVAQILSEEKVSNEYLSSLAMDLDYPWLNHGSLRGTLYGDILKDALRNYQSSSSGSPLLLGPILHYGSLGMLQNHPYGTLALDHVLNLRLGGAIFPRHIAKSGNIALLVDRPDGKVDLWVSVPLRRHNAKVLAFLKNPRVEIRPQFAEAPGVKYSQAADSLEVFRIGFGRDPWSVVLFCYRLGCLGLTPDLDPASIPQLDKIPRIGSSLHPRRRMRLSATSINIKRAKVAMRNR